jgi:hypothetical protein
MHDAVGISFSQKLEMPVPKRMEKNWGGFARKDPDLIFDFQPSRYNTKETILCSG